MPYDSKAIRPLVLALIKNSKNQILVSPGYDKTKQESFYRLLGGGLEFGEKALAALHREIKEELNLELTNCRLLEISENVFTFNSLPGHEIIFLFSADFLDPANYNTQEFTILDSDHEGRAIWLDLANLKNTKVYPDISAWL